MIQSQDRSNYIGASDTSMVVGNWETKTFEKWWLEKIGLNRNNLSTEAMKAGNNYEHKILEALEIESLEMDKQIIKDRLRVNLDGNTSTCIYEIKTHNIDKEFKVSKQYWRQAQVEMYASGIHDLYIIAYALKEEDYKNYFNDIDKRRIQKIKVDYDENFINCEYLPRLKILMECLKSGTFPRKKGKINETKFTDCRKYKNFCKRN